MFATRPNSVPGLDSGIFATFGPACFSTPKAVFSVAGGGQKLVRPGKTDSVTLTSDFSRYSGDYRVATKIASFPRSIPFYSIRAWYNAGTPAQRRGVVAGHNPQPSRPHAREAATKDQCNTSLDHPPFRRVCQQLSLSKGNRNDKENFHLLSRRISPRAGADCHGCNCRAHRDDHSFAPVRGNLHWSWSIRTAISQPNQVISEVGPAYAGPTYGGTNGRT